MKRLVALFGLLALGSVFAHAELASSDPEAGSVVSGQPESIVLEFTEPVETAFSAFKVYRLDADVDMSADNAQQRLAGLAAALVNEVMSAQEDGDGRVDVGIEPATGTSTEITLELAPDLAAGHYVVMWQVLSIDTHVMPGHFVFSVE